MYIILWPCKYYSPWSQVMCYHSILFLFLWLQSMSISPNSKSMSKVWTFLAFHWMFAISLHLNLLHNWTMTFLYGCIFPWISTCHFFFSFGRRNICFLHYALILSKSLVILSFAWNPLLLFLTINFLEQWKILLCFEKNESDKIYFISKMSCKKILKHVS